MSKEPINIDVAKVIASKTDEELVIYISFLLDWIQDTNDPGADIISDRLICIPLEIMMVPLGCASLFVNKFLQDPDKQKAFNSFSEAHYKKNEDQWKKFVELTSTQGGDISDYFKCFNLPQYEN